MPSEDAGALVAEPRAAFGSGPASEDEASLPEYSMDASPCLVPPKAVVRAGSEAEVARLLVLGTAHGVPLTPRARPFRAPRSVLG